MRISGAFASASRAATIAKSGERVARVENRRCHFRAGYVVALAWVIVALGLYAFQILKLAVGLG
jgi:hypothetical protein